MCHFTVILTLSPLFCFTGQASPQVSQTADSATFPGDYFPPYRDSVMQFNHFGSFGSFYNGISARLDRVGTNQETKPFSIFSGYSYRNFDGYREHSSLYAHNFDLEFGTRPSSNTGLRVTGHYFRGRSLMPGSLTREEFDQDPWKADPRAVGRDEFRETSRGQAEIAYDADFGRSLSQHIEIRGYGQIEYFERSTREFKITTRYVLGLSARYVNHSRFWNRNSEFTAGADIFDQPERKEEYENFGGQRSDQLEQVEVEKTVSSGCYLSEKFEIVPRKMFLAIIGKYNYVVYSVTEETLPARSDRRNYHAFTPEATLDYQVRPALFLFASFNMGFRSPTDRELESPVPAYLYNQDLEAQTSATLKAGVKGDFNRARSARFFRKLSLEADVFLTGIRNEIVQYEIYGDLYYRNASRTNRFGVTVKTRLELLRNLDFSIGYAHAHYEYVTYTANSLEADSTGNIVSIYRDFSGHFEPNIPADRLKLALAYRYPVRAELSLFASVSYLAAGGLWVDDNNSQKTDSYQLLDAEAGFDLHLGHFLCSVKGGVNNTFDRIYVGTTNINSADRRFYDAGSPRDFFGSVVFDYLF